MQKRWFAIILTILAGCSDAAFSIRSSIDASIQSEDVINNDSDSAVELNDTGTGLQDVKINTDAPLVCENFSCKPGCGVCDAGMTCGTAGSSVCGGNNCDSWEEDAGVCTDNSSLPRLFQCTPQTKPDIMPNCMFKFNNSGMNWYCCKQ